MGHTVSCPLLPQYAGQGKHHHPPPQVSHEPAPSAPSDDPGRASPWLCHPKQGRAQQDARGVSQKAKGAKADENATIIFGLRTCFGGGKSTCFALSMTTLTPPRRWSRSTAKSGLASGGKLLE